ncbi:MAG: hypothetical protein AAGF75_03735 [Cyanobacteria bacterium P01_H01_bin.130]
MRGHCSLNPAGSGFEDFGRSRDRYITAPPQRHYSAVITLNQRWGSEGQFLDFRISYDFPGMPGGPGDNLLE